MPSPFALLEDQLSDTCNEVFGERLELRPMIQGPGGGRRSPDPDRTTYQVTGIVDRTINRSTAIGATERGSSPFILRIMRVSIDRRQITQWPLRQHDRILIVETGEMVEIASRPEDGEGRYMLDCTFVKRES